VQIELDSGKRVKVKAANVLLRFDKPAPAELIAAQRWPPRSTSTWPGSSRPRTSSASPTWRATTSTPRPGPSKQAAALFRLFEAPHYFRRAGKGRFRKAPEEIVKAALLGIERKKQVAAQIEAWAGEIGGRAVPGAGARPALPHPLQARQERARIQGRGRGRAARAAFAAGPAAGAGAIDSPYQFHWKRFLFEQFPQGTGFPALAAPAIKDELPLADVQAFSIDDSATTEIDDALSVQGLGSGTVVFGVHIAAPGLAISPTARSTRWRATAVHRLHAGLEADHAARRGGAGLHADRRPRLPGRQPVRHARRGHAGVRKAARRGWNACPSPPTCGTTSSTRHHRSLAHRRGPGRLRHAPSWPLPSAWRGVLKARREVVRGKPETFNRPDYNFKLERRRRRTDRHER
jgi:exoribonuclease-2